MADVVVGASGDEEGDSKTTTTQSKGRNFRRNRKSASSSSSSASSSDSEGSSDGEELLKLKINEARIKRELRKRPNGISAIGLALGKKVTMEEMLTNDPFRLKTGGMIDMKALKTGKITDSDGIAIGTAFSAETNQRDEDADMMKYIEEELVKRKNEKAAENKLMRLRTGFDSEQHNEPDSDSHSSEWLKKPEDALYEVPEHLRVSSSKKSEEMLSNQMLSGIPEVDLGIEAKIRNIEATEEAKQKLVREKMNKKDVPSQFVPTNMAVNFVQHNRFNIEEETPKPKRFKQSRPVPVVGGDGEGGTVIFRREDKKVAKNRDEDEKATDDFHFEKFKKQFRRY